MAAVGVFLATLVWLGWDGGAVGATIASWLEDALGVAAYVLPVLLIGLGGLMLVRSALINLRPFRTGVAVSAVGLMIALGTDHGGAVGSGLGGGLARVIGDTGALIVGVALVLAGVLLFTGASAGALLRGSGHAMRRAGSAARRSLDGFELPERQRRGDIEPPARAERPALSLVDGAAKYPTYRHRDPGLDRSRPRSCCRGSTKRTR